MDRTINRDAIGARESAAYWGHCVRGYLVMMRAAMGDRTAFADHYAQLAYQCAVYAGTAARVAGEQ